MTDPYKNPLPDDHPITPRRLSELARYLFGHAVLWDSQDMRDYDRRPARRIPWEHRIATQIAALGAPSERGEA